MAQRKSFDEALAEMAEAGYDVDSLPLHQMRASYDAGRVVHFNAMRPRQSERMGFADAKAAVNEAFELVQKETDLASFQERLAFVQTRVPSLERALADHGRVLCNLAHPRCERAHLDALLSVSEMNLAGDESRHKEMLDILDRTLADLGKTAHDES